MSEKLARAARMGATTTVIPKKVEVNDLAELAATMKQIADSQREMQQQFVSALEQIVAGLDKKSSNNPDIGPLIQAVTEMKPTLIKEPVDYEIDFDRDQRHLLKAPIRLTAVPRRMH
jgi:hypothetical protein